MTRLVRFIVLLVVVGLAILLVGCGLGVTPATPTPTPSPTPIPTTVNLAVIGGKQTKPLTCESQSASDLAKFWGKSVGEMEFFNRLPRSDNPFKGFVGSPDAPAGSLPPVGYGVYAEPVAATLRHFGLEAEAQSKRGINWLRQELAAGRPVIVWSTYGFKEMPVKTYTTRDNQPVPVVQYEHTFLAIGYDTTGVWVIDPLDAQRKNIAYADFMRGWNLLDQMAVSARLPTPAKTSSTSPSPVPATVASSSVSPWWPGLALALLAAGLLVWRGRHTRLRPARLAQTADFSMARRTRASVLPKLPAFPGLGRLRPLGAAGWRVVGWLTHSPLTQPLPLALLGILVGLMVIVWAGSVSPCFTMPILAVGGGLGFWLGLWAQAGRQRTMDGRR